MPRSKLIKTHLFYYHVTTRSNHKEWFKIPLQEVWDICVISINKALKKYPAEISQFILMANHYHMLIKTPNCDLDKFMYIFNKSFSELLRNNSGQINRMFGGRYKWSLVDNNNYLQTVEKYIYQNPVKANIVTKCENYPYSTLWYEHNRDKSLALKKFKFRAITTQYLDYLNEQFEASQHIRIKNGLKRSKFKEIFHRKSSLRK